MAVFQNAITGFNVNIPRRGKSYHVQTEDSGINNPHIITHLFLGGNIISTTKTSYEDILAEPDLTARVREMMEDQHKAMIRDLLDGKFDEKASQSVQLHAPKVDMLTPYQEPIKRHPRSTPSEKKSEEQSERNEAISSQRPSEPDGDAKKNAAGSAVSQPGELLEERRPEDAPIAPEQTAGTSSMSSHETPLTASPVPQAPRPSADEELQRAIAAYFAKSRITFSPRPSP